MPSHHRRTSRLLGWLFVGTFVFSIPGYLLYGELLDDRAWVLAGGGDARITVGAFHEILTAICNIGTAVVLYPVARRFTPRAALGYVASRIVESTIIVAGIVSVLSVLTLREQYAGAAQDSFSVTGQALVAFHDWTFLLGPGFCAGIGNGLLLGWIMYCSGLITRRVAIFGMVAGAFAFTAATGALLGVYERQSVPQSLLTVPEIAWELTFGVWMIVRGFSSPARSQSEESRVHRAAAVPAV